MNVISNHDLTITAITPQSQNFHYHLDQKATPQLRLHAGGSQPLKIYPSAEEIGEAAPWQQKEP